MSYIHIYTKTIDAFNTHAIFISDKQEGRFVGKREKAINDGYELFFDSATSLEHAVTYCEEFEVAPDYCVNCATYTSTSLYRGRKADLRFDRWRVFNGYLCEPCATDSFLFEVIYVSDYKPKLF